MTKPAPITKCPVLHEDQHLIVVNKPHGVLSHPNPKSPKPQRSAFEGRYDTERRCFQTSAGEVFLIHRLDQDTSGLLLAAKDEKTADKCRKAFEAEQVQKKYLALCSGGGLKSEGVWLDYLVTEHAQHQVRTAVRRGPRPNAELRYRLRHYNAAQRLSLLEIDLITGKTHQIRVQAASRHLPLVGDDVYGSFEQNRALKKTLQVRRIFLHAFQMALKHPASGQALLITAVLPADLNTVLAAAQIPFHLG
ncbi:MAG: RluA family pseudouridine synthase [Prosthecobacter sp.]